MHAKSIAVGVDCHFSPSADVLIESASDLSTKPNLVNVEMADLADDFDNLYC